MKHAPEQVLLQAGTLSWPWANSLWGGKAGRLRRLATLSGLVLASLCLLSVSSAAGLPRAGSFDPSFGSEGVVTHSPGAGGISAIAVQPDGKIVVAGGSAIARYLPNGSPDSSFGKGGYVEAPAGAVASRVAVEPDGKIVVAGNHPQYAESSEFIVARYDSYGSLDKSFGTGGVVTTVIPAPPGYSNDACGGPCPPSSAVAALAILPGGDIVAAGSTFGLAEDECCNYWLSSIALVRYTSDGSLDPTFGKSGIAETGGPDYALDGISVLPSGKIVATGAGYGLGKDDNGEWITLARYLPDGALDPSFGTKGTGTVSTGYEFGDLAGGPSALQDGKIVVAGSGQGPHGVIPVLARFGANGRLDTSFGHYGFAKIRLGSGGASTVVAQADGKILFATGSSVVRLTPDGELSTSFGAGGVMHVGTPVSSLALQADGKILVGGGSGGSWTLARLFGSTECAVPRVRGETIAEATATLRKSYCTRGTIAWYPSSTVTHGQVIYTTPAPGAYRPHGYAVELVVSEG